MLITKLAAKLHGVRVTGADLNYEGSIALDETFLLQSGMEVFEKVDIYNVSTGGRFSTYIIKAPKGSKQATLNGASARMVQTGDKIIVCCFRQYERGEWEGVKVLLFDDENNFNIQAYTVRENADE